MNFATVREYHPLKQGLRRILLNFFNNSAFVREYHPLKQGLRLIVCRFPAILFAGVREYHPLKQGLRPFNNFTVRIFFLCQRVSSIKTRIKTIVFS